MAKASNCSSMAAPRLLVIASGLLVGYFVLVLIMRLAANSRASVGVRIGYDRFTQEALADIVYLYMDGCGHCKQFDPTWLSFHDQYADSLLSAGVSMRKLASDDPSAKSLGVTGFPTVLLVYKTGAEPVQFEGPRTVAGLATFVQTNVPAFVL